MGYLNKIQDSRDQKPADNDIYTFSGEPALMILYGPEEQKQDKADHNGLKLHKGFMYDTVPVQKDREHTGLIKPDLGIIKPMHLQSKYGCINCRIDQYKSSYNVFGNPDMTKFCRKHEKRKNDPYPSGI